MLSPTQAYVGDYLDFASDLSEAEQTKLVEIRAFMHNRVKPVINEYWERAEFPHELLADFAATGVLALPFPEYSPLPASALFHGLVVAELARVDTGFCTFTGVSSGLTMHSINVLGSQEQKDRYLPGLAKGEIVGSFALTEPLHGSDVAGGLTTSARREGDRWVLNGEKRWIGNATWGDIVIVWARDEADHQIKGFIVPTDIPGYTATKIEGKYSQRTVQNADIVLSELRLPDTQRLPGANSFADTARILTITRLDVAWGAIGNAIGAYETALAYAKQREQFGKPIAAHQLVQDLLVRSLGNINSALALTARVAVLAGRGEARDVHSAQAKAYATARGREVVAWSRELLGGNGIVIDYDAMRHFVDAEAIYSFEGTREMNTLIVGRDITGLSAFV